MERAVHSAGGPSPGDGPGQIACQHKSSQDLNPDENGAIGRISGPQLKAVENVANGGGSGAGTGKLGGESKMLEVEPDDGGAGLASSAAAALPALSKAAANAVTTGAKPTGS